MKALIWIPRWWKVTASEERKRSCLPWNGRHTRGMRRDEFLLFMKD